MSYEKTVKEVICTECHVAIMRPHHEEKKANDGYFVCPICGFTKVIHERKRKSDIVKKRK